MNELIYNDWEGGIPGGSIRLYKNSYVVRFTNRRSSFSIKKYDDEEKALNAAKQYQLQIAKEEGVLRNQYRMVKTDKKSYYEVKLQGEFIAKIDIEDLNKIKHCVWSAHKSHNRYYMQHSNRKKSSLPTERFHTLLFPNWKMVDHINRNGLDNRKNNLRDGTNINNTNQTKRKDNTSGKVGVHYSEYDKCWHVQWYENNKRKHIRFSTKKYGDNAKLLAIKLRMENDIKNNNKNGYISDEEHQVTTKLPDISHIDIKPKTKSGITGLYYSETYNNWNVVWKENNKRKTKRFSTKNRSKEDAKKIAIDFHNSLVID